MRIYSFDDIASRGSCVAFVRDVIGAKIANGRCQAVWRNGKNEGSVSLSDKEWYDHSDKVGGGLLQLCQIAKFGAINNSTIQQAQEFLGDWLHLTPKQVSKKVEPEESLYNKLVKEGYRDTARYYYRDLNGNVVHIVIKMTHPSRPKQFVQRTPQGWGLGSTIPILYNLSAINSSSWVVIVEGEKDAETLIKLGVPATTNAGGSKKWRKEYNEIFRGKIVVVCRDNDDAGRAHAFVVMRNVARVASQIKVICPSALPKGDVTDWLEKEGGTPELLYRMMNDAKTITPDDAEKSEFELDLIEAKLANAKPFSNMATGGKVEIDGEISRSSTERPRKVSELVEDCRKRFLGFPRKLGDESLFDHDRDTNDIYFIRKVSDLFAWIGEKSKQSVVWTERANGAVSRNEFYSSLVKNAIRYEGISYVPDWPQRSDTYYAYGEIPEADGEHHYLDHLMSFFNPADDCSAIMLRALFAAPIYYKYAVQRPCWIIDSVDAQSSGKTTIVEILAYLYKCKPVSTTPRELDDDFSELIKRVISAEGRNSRVMLVDNVKGTFKSANFAKLVTQWDLSGKAPYGHGEEQRPNNFTYCVTANSASVDSDIASRSFFIYIKNPRTRSENWKSDVLGFIDAYRYHIFADIMAILESHIKFERLPVTRCPEFEVEIMQAMCYSVEEYDAVCKRIVELRAETNIEEEQARQIDEIISFRLSDLGLDPEIDRVFIRSDVVSMWVSDIKSDSKNTKITVQDIRNLAKINMLPMVDKHIRQYPLSTRGVKAKYRRAGIMWCGVMGTTDVENSIVVIVGFGPAGSPIKVATIYPDGSAQDEVKAQKPQQQQQGLFNNDEVELP